MPAFLAPLLMGLASTAGTILTNRANKAEARRQEAFQERMSSTAVRRSIADYEAAGLNPALAYSHGGASTPGGASAQIGNAVESGISSARSASLAREQIKTEQQRRANEAALTNEDVRVKRSQTALNSVHAGTQLAQGNLLQAQIEATRAATDFHRISQPYQLRQAIADALLTEAEIPRASNYADYARKLGILQPGVEAGLNVLGSGLSSANQLRRLMSRGGR